MALLALALAVTTGLLEEAKNSVTATAAIVIVGMNGIHHLVTSKLLFPRDEMLFR